MANSDGHKSPDLFDSAAALRLDGFLIAAGAVTIACLAIAVGTGAPAALGVIGIGLIVAFGATVAGGLLGFIFGVPHMRDGASGSAPSLASAAAALTTSNSNGTPPAAATSGTDTNGAAGSNMASANGANAVSSSLQYRPNTSLEQISDWLAKMIVGVGLVEVKSIPIRLKYAASYVSKGLGGSLAAEIWAWGALILFPFCGFLYGFLWGRFNLRRLFSDGDRELVQEVSRFNHDISALALAPQQLNRRDNKPCVSQDQLEKVIAKSSPVVRTQILVQAKERSRSSAMEDDAVKEGAISVHEAIIAADKKQPHHEAHAELAYALTRQSPADCARANAELDHAIRTRNPLKKSGWRYYEFRRARNRINLDESVDAIVADLTAACSDETR